MFLLLLIIPQTFYFSLKNKVLSKSYLSPNKKDALFSFSHKKKTRNNREALTLRLKNNLGVTYFLFFCVTQYIKESHRLPILLFSHFFCLFFYCAFIIITVSKSSNNSSTTTVKKNNKNIFKSIVMKMRAAP